MEDFRIVVNKDNKAIVAVDDPKVLIETEQVIHAGSAEELRDVIVKEDIDITNIKEAVLPYLAELGITEEDLKPYIHDVD